MRFIEFLCISAFVIYQRQPMCDSLPAYEWEILKINERMIDDDVPREESQKAASTLMNRLESAMCASTSSHCSNHSPWFQNFQSRGDTGERLLFYNSTHKQISVVFVGARGC